MKTCRFLLTVALLGVSTLVSTSAARACKYCWAAEAAAGDLSQQALLQQDQTNSAPGAFPLDSTISQFKPTAAPTALATPPPAGSIATSAADLRTVAAPARATALPKATATGTVRPAASGHYADAGLLGLAAVGGVFWLRTRRKAGSDR